MLCCGARCSGGAITSTWMSAGASQRRAGSKNREGRKGEKRTVLSSVAGQENVLFIARKMD